MCQRVCRFAVFQVLLLILISAAPPESEAILVEVSIPELVQMADHVVHAKVISASSHWNDDQTQILTSVLIRINDAYLGQLADSALVTVICPGGVVDGLAMEVEHSPVFVVEEEIVVFLTTIDKSACRVSGWEAGKFTVKKGLVVENGRRMTEFRQQIVDAVKSAGRR